MKKTPLPLEKFRLRHFKAVRDSGEVRFTPLTVFIGNNGSGKSSLIEGLETLQNLALHGPDEAFLPWGGFEHVWNSAVSHQVEEDQIGQRAPANPMRFEASGATEQMFFVGSLEVSTDNAGNRVFIMNRDAKIPGPSALTASIPNSGALTPERLWPRFVARWQFLNLDPQHMLLPQPQRRSIREVRLARDGANIAQYLQSIDDKEPGILEGIVETLKSVLPFALDLRPAITRELQRNVYLRLQERGIEEPLAGWLLSQGTLRIVALLAVLRHPEPPSVVFIEELENGLDPRTIHLLVEEIRLFLQSGGQVVATTHSPYLLDLLDLSQIIVVERSHSGAPVFRRPSKRKLKNWAEQFAPGRLYTMGNLTEG